MTILQKLKNIGFLIRNNKIIVSQYIIIILLCYVILVLIDINNTLHSTLWNIRSIPNIENQVSDIENQVSDMHREIAPSLKEQYEKNNSFRR